MSDKGHTPGPWIADGWMVYAGATKRPVAQAVTVALSDTIRDDETRQIAERSRIGDAEATANARLIALAPEMLEALRYLVSANAQYFDHPDRRLSLEKARAILARIWPERS